MSIGNADGAAGGLTDGRLIATVAPSVGTLPQGEWDILAGSDNPFMSHAFLTALEESASVGPGTGWSPAPIVIEGPDGKLAGALPAYVKNHSQGEYVFDHNWADAWQRAGGSYYPKLQIAAPFTPATGRRVLLTDERYAQPLLHAAQQLCIQNGFSSAHATFIEPGQLKLFEQAGWLARSDVQFHWTNRDYQNFEDFLGELTSRKRKSLRKERAAAQQGVRIEQLRGADIKPEHWDAFWYFYQDTGARKWGTPYLTREAFELFSQKMANQLLLIMAFAGDVPIAGALNFIGGSALYGRYWGCRIDKPFLHFELCYYQAIDAAIELGLSRVEAGAQGGHKLARGYEPVQTWSAHYLVDPGFRSAVADFLVQERAGISDHALRLGDLTPFKKS